MNVAELATTMGLAAAAGGLTGYWASRRAFRRLVRVLDAEHLARKARPGHGRLLDPREVVASKLRLLGAVLGHRGGRL